MPTIQTSDMADKKIQMEMVAHAGEHYFKIANSDAMRPFFMTIVSDANHWMYISSNGGLSAGRKNPEYALFPYYTDDKITESADLTGSKTLLQVHTPDGPQVWEPFSERFTGRYRTSRNLYKSVSGNKILFEEINHDLGLTFRYQWSASKEYGFVRHAELLNDSAHAQQIVLLDGLQNIMPHGVPSDLQRSTSNLVDAYKRSELDADTGLGIYALSAIIVDKAEPSEALKANVVWSLGLQQPTCLLSAKQVAAFRQGGTVQGEADVKGEKGAYFVSQTLELAAHTQTDWLIVANVNQSHAQVVALCEAIRTQTDLRQRVLADVDAGTRRLRQLVASADGLQATADHLNDTRHFSNVLFNIMRGGIFDDNYQIERADFATYLAKANATVAAKNADFIAKLGQVFSLSALKAHLLTTDDADLKRLGMEYLPLKFSRRHGDPSRPWNYFSINTENETDGTKVLDYEGNWRDLFQNWEALSLAYPDFIEGMIFKFLNASTFDGYNPYRVTKGGFDWETIEPDNPWSYIGYWGDHQIIYLQKFLEIIDKHHPGALQAYFDKEWFVYAGVPYIIKPYADILDNPKDTIAFDHHWDTRIRTRRETLGADGALLTTGDQGGIYHVNFIEKILATVLAKVSNFIPETGIWMSTQRPEWNDANNALVGNGVSMVTLYYLHRFLTFFQRSLAASDLEAVKVSDELAAFYHSIREALLEYRPLLAGSISDTQRKAILDRLGMAASEYRQQIYQNGFWGNKRSISLGGLTTFTEVCLDFITHAIRANQRPDKLYHAYNLMAVEGDRVTRAHLSEMLEGQVAVLSAGYLRPNEAVEVLDALKGSALFRQDQYSYILYPNKNLPGFLHKNNIPEADVQTSALLRRCLADGNRQLVERDVRGGVHFNGNFKNARDLDEALQAMATGEYAELATRERALLLGIFEKLFNHKAFTGRSGTFFGYEGLGSIYWHMVSKLLLAVQECCQQAIAENADPKVVGRLLEHYYEIEAGIGVHKSPELYGAFPTDAYSHTPQHRGAQQPGMTGQVKEDILARFGELGVQVQDGRLAFRPTLLRKAEFAEASQTFGYVGIDQTQRQLETGANALAFTYCQVPVVYALADAAGTVVTFADGTTQPFDASGLDAATSRQVFERTGAVAEIRVAVPKAVLR